MSERLTYRDEKGIAHIICKQMCSDANVDCTTPCETDLCQRYVAFGKLAEYEDLEEQGLLLRLPCKVGNFIYYPSLYYNVVIPVMVNEITISFTGIDNYSFQYNCCSFDGYGDVWDEYEFDNSDIGKTVFLTQSEAEEKLRELEERYDGE